MYLKITDQAQERLQKYIDEGATVILDVDDGVGEYSKMGVCSLDTSFRLLLLDKEQVKNVVMFFNVARLRLVLWIMDQ